MRNSESTSMAVRRVLLALGLLAGASALTACNTTEGVGEDIEELGDSIDDAAEDAS